MALSRATRQYENCFSGGGEGEEEGELEEEGLDILTGLLFFEREFFCLDEKLVGFNGKFDFGFWWTAKSSF